MKYSTIAVDFDGTVVDHQYPDIGPEAPNAIRVLKWLNGMGHKLILNTMRSDEELQEAVEWFKENQIELYGVAHNPTQKGWTNSPKCYANHYIDDAAVGCPLLKLPEFNRPCVNWLEIEKYFKGEITYVRNNSD